MPRNEGSANGRPRAFDSIGALVAASGPPFASCYLTGRNDSVVVTLTPVSLMLLAVTPE